MENQKESPFRLTDTFQAFCLTLDWAYDGDHGVEVQSFTDENEARAAFKKLVEHEKCESWIADKQVSADADGNPEDGSLVIDEDTDTDFYAFIQGWEFTQYTSVKLTRI